MTYHIYLYKLIMLCKTTVISRMSHCPSWSSNFVPRPVSGCAKDHWRMTHLAASSWRVVAVVRNKFNVWVADKITYYPQWTWPKWVAPYRLWMCSHNFGHPMSTPHCEKWGGHGLIPWLVACAWSHSYSGFLWNYLMLWEIGMGVSHAANVWTPQNSPNLQRSYFLAWQLLC